MSHRIWVLDADGTLIHLPVNIEIVRSQLRDLFKAERIELGFKPILPHILQAVQIVAIQHHAEKARQYHQQAYQILSQGEAEAVPRAKAAAHAAEFLHSLKSDPVLIVTNNAAGPITAALQASGLKINNLIRLVGRDLDHPPKPDPMAMLECLSSQPAPLGQVIFIGDGISDMQMASNAAWSIAQRGGKTIALGISPNSENEIALKQAGAHYVVPHLGLVKHLGITMP